MLSRSIQIFIFTLLYIFISLFAPFYISNWLQVKVISTWNALRDLLIVIMVFQGSFWTTYYILKKLKVNLYIKLLISTILACLIWGIFANLYYMHLNTKAFAACLRLSGPIISRERRDYIENNIEMEIHNYGKIEDFLTKYGKPSGVDDKKGFQTYYFSTKTSGSCNLHVNKSTGIIENTSTMID